MPTSVEDFIRTKKKVLCAPYLYNSVLIFDGCSLYLCSQLFTESNATLSYGRMIELELCPPPSADLLFSSLCSNDSGSFAAIIAPYGVYLVDLPRHLWVLQSADVQSTIEQWSEKYYCRCEAVNQNLMLTDRAPLVTKFSWCKRSWKELGHSRTTKFAVLYSDDVIRLYDANVCFTSPLLKIDFRSMLSPADSSGSRFHRLGLFNSIASFDFGPRIECRDECSGETVHLSTIFAVDTEHNDIYVAAFRLDSNIVFNSIGPLALQPVLASDKASDLCDLLFLRCSESGLLNVFAFVTGDGLLVHFLPLFSCVDLVDHSLDCELYMYDMIKIPTISQEISPVIFKGSSEVGCYIIVTRSNVFHVNIQPWVKALAAVLQEEFERENEDITFQETILHHVFQLYNDKSCADNNTSDMNRIFVSPVVRRDSVKNMSPVLSGGRMLVIAAFDAEAQLMTRYIEIEGEQKSRKGTKKPISLVREVPSEDDLLVHCNNMLNKRISIPAVKFNGKMKEEDMIRVGLETISSHIHNLQVMKETANFVQTRIRDLLNRSDALEKQKATYNEYFLSCLKDYLALKDKLYSVQQNVRKLYVRVNQVCSSSIIAKPTAKAEHELLDSLYRLQSSVEDCIHSIPQLENEVMIRRAESLGQMVPFHPSLNARKFMLRKGQEDVDKMIAWVKHLKQKVDAIQGERTLSASLSPPVSPQHV